MKKTVKILISVTVAILMIIESTGVYAAKLIKPSSSTYTVIQLDDEKISIIEEYARCIPVFEGDEIYSAAFARDAMLYFSNLGNKYFSSWTYDSSTASIMVDYSEVSRLYKEIFGVGIPGGTKVEGTRILAGGELEYYYTYKSEKYKNKYMFAAGDFGEEIYVYKKHQSDGTGGAYVTIDIKIDYIDDKYDRYCGTRVLHIVPANNNTGFIVVSNTSDIPNTNVNDMYFDDMTANVVQIRSFISKGLYLEAITECENAVNWHNASAEDKKLINDLKTFAQNSYDMYVGYNEIKNKILRNGTKNGDKYILKTLDIPYVSFEYTPFREEICIIAYMHYRAGDAISVWLSPDNPSPSIKLDYIRGVGDLGSDNTPELNMRFTTYFNNRTTVYDSIGHLPDEDMDESWYNYNYFLQRIDMSLKENTGTSLYQLGATYVEIPMKPQDGTYEDMSASVNQIKNFIEWGMYNEAVTECSNAINWHNISQADIDLFNYLYLEAEYRHGAYLFRTYD